MSRLISAAMSDTPDLLRATRYESSDPATLEEADDGRRLWALYELIASAVIEREAFVIPLRARR